jgi:RNA polymerase sigma factor (sigma-70 family)
MTKDALGTVIRQIRHLIGARQGSDRTDADLLQCFVAHGEEQAFAELMNRHGPMVLSVCRRLTNSLEDADDAFQATFLVLVRKGGSIRKGESVGSWLYGVAIRVAREARIREDRRRLRDRQAMNLTQIDPSTQTDVRELRVILDEELDQLPAKYRSPMVLHYLEGKTKEETARELGWTEGTVSGRLARARDLLRNRLTRRGLTFSSGMMTALLSEQGASAIVPTVLPDSTMKSAMFFTLVEVAHGATAAAGNALAEAVLKAMLVSKVKHVVAMVSVLGVLAAGIGVAAQRTLTSNPAASQQESGNELRAEKVVRLDPPRDSQPASVRAERLFGRMEDTLAKVKTLECFFEIKLGILSYEGNLFLAEGNRARLEINEATKERRMRSFLVSNGVSLSYQDNGMSKSQVSKTPKDLNRGILTWLARPGIFVPQCPLPDVAAEDAKDRFPVSGFQFGNREKIGERESQRLEYQLSVKGQMDPMSVTVWLDVKTELPVKRVVTSAGQEVTVVETYEKLSLNEKVDAKKFELAR